jgi:hypothetical protein
MTDKNLALGSLSPEDAQTAAEAHVGEAATPERFERITFEFEYAVPDEYLSQSMSKGLKAKWTYSGPKTLYVFVKQDTHKLEGKFHYHDGDDGHLIPTPPGEVKIAIDPTKEPLVASIIYNDLDYGTLPHTEEALPNGKTYGAPIPTPPDHCYEISEIEWDPVAGKFKPLTVLKDPHMTWDGIKASRNNQLKWSDMKVRTCNPAEVKAWEDFRQELRDLPTVWKGIDAWKVQFPQQPSA